jgi:hypothetical protein
MSAPDAIKAIDAQIAETEARLAVLGASEVMREYHQRIGALLALRQLRADLAQPVHDSAVPQLNANGGCVS